MSCLSPCRASAAAALTLCWVAAAAAQPVTFTGNYTQNFDSMGQAGTAPPAGWSLFTIAGDSSTWTNTSGSDAAPPTPGILASQVAGGTLSTGLTARLIDAGNVAGNNSNGYNAATGAAPNDRTIATAPTGIAGNAIELQLVNNSGVAQTNLTIGYDIRRLQAGAASGTRTPPAGIPPGSDEVPGFWLFYSLDNGATFTNVAALNPTGAGTTGVVVPNTVGTTTVPPTRFNLTSPWAPGSNLVLRWADDNAFDPSPDPIYGLDNVSVVGVPEPASLLSLSAVALLAGARTAVRRRRNAAADAPAVS